MPPKRQPKKKVVVETEELELHMEEEEGEMGQDEQVKKTTGKIKTYKRKASPVKSPLKEDDSDADDEGDDVKVPEPSSKKKSKSKGKKASKVQLSEGGEPQKDKKDDVKKVIKTPLPPKAKKAKKDKEAQKADQVDPETPKSKKSSESNDEVEEVVPQQQQKKGEKMDANAQELDDDDDQGEAVVTPQPQGKKTKKEKEPKAPLTDAEKAKKAGYAKLMRREGAREVGSKEIPVGKPNCLGGLKFVITGVMDSIGDRKAGEAIIKRYGGVVTTAVSKKTNYLIVGREPGDKKVSRAVECSVEQLDEDDFLNLLRVSTSK